MTVEGVYIDNESQFMKDYRNQSASVMPKFHYNPYDEQVDKQRLLELDQRAYPRNELVEHLYVYNEKLGADTKTLSQIKRLSDEKSVVIVGGQQTGLLSGPLYTIHKIISILLLAKKKEQELNRPVIPVFWMAGEDHDFEEINHIFLPEEKRMKKMRILQKEWTKKPTSQITLDQEAFKQWMDRIFELLPETENTRMLYVQITDIANQSETYVDFFGRFIHHLFQEEGLVLLDSNHPEIRKIEKDFFKLIVIQQKGIASGTEKMVMDLIKGGYPKPFDANTSDGHLFFHKNEERVLLVRDQDGHWVGKNGDIAFTEPELLHLIQETPEQFSNNVVTRPVMQDLLLPTLGFVGGPGEIAYWGALKLAFEAANIRMPPVYPRLSLTLIDREVQKWGNQLHFSLKDAIENGLLTQKNHWLRHQANPPIEKMGDELKFVIEEAQRPIKEFAQNVGKDLGQLAEKNLIHMFREVDYLQDRIYMAMEEKYEQTLSKYNRAHIELRPENGLQERCWNIVYWMNLYGTDLSKRLLRDDYDWAANHHIFYL
ncbi:bacillithiol biosynthesis cysteine-adding enzyme BshC [Bacillaceae bacterium S4-13-58]